ncbi:ATP-dependent DNA helicase PIF2-like [Ipomoea triloba]|uniref:ATP-dependent DNA helicase PIF2-like n=1 Tax=Ipomoea triloba TaxID=35885 RepID=UPI00125DCD50|nr:ATP-dependent DNA helicase PIF2-like [Ipomoea triloba]
MHIPDEPSNSLLVNPLIYEELSYDRQLLKEEHDLLVGNLTDEQLLIYNKVMYDVDTNKGGLFFVYGYGGTGKTFLWKTLSAALRSRGEIVLNVASSGIASLLLPGGRTAHSRFAIPISINEDSTCNIKQGSPLAELIIKAKLIIWDEAPMMHKHCFEALDKTMRDILRFSDSLSCNKTFGGKTVVLGGDFRHILPVIPKGTRQDIVQASINSSYLWTNCQVLRLTKNLRLRSVTAEGEIEKLDAFAKWIADLGDGKLGGNTEDDCNINIPSQFLLQNRGDPIKQIVDETFPTFGTGVIDPEQLKSRAILAPTLDVVDQFKVFWCTKPFLRIKGWISNNVVEEYRPFDWSL